LNCWEFIPLVAFSQLGQMTDTSKSSLLYFPKTVFSKRFGKQFFSMDITGVEIANQDSCWDKHAVYLLTMKQGKAEWVIKRRFREFDAFCQEIRKIETVSNSLPNLPPKTCFRNTEDEGFLNERREQLYDFLDMLLKELSQKNLLSNRSIVQFLEIDPNTVTEES
jgi:hypothetical protein